MMMKTTWPSVRMVRFLLCGVVVVTLVSRSVASAQPIDTIFPAAQSEWITQNSTTLLTLRPEKLVAKLSSPSNETEEFLLSAYQIFLQRTFDEASLPDFPHDYPVPGDNFDLVPLHKVVLTATTPATTLSLEMNESYSLSMHKDPPAVDIDAATIFGVRHGLETLSQLIEFGWIDPSDGSAIYIIRNADELSIVDYPAFPYRGLLIDTARHYLPMSLILRNLDAMAMNKLNVMHWHITDDSSFPYLSKKFPELAEKGAYAPKRVYTIEQVQTVIQQAYLRGIRVVPEFDMPGHTSAIGRSHPELMSPPPGNNSEYAYANVLDPTNPNVYDFVEQLYTEITTVFPDAYVHLGGDEVNMECWNASTRIQQWMHDHNLTELVQVYEYFETRLLDIVGHKLDKKTIVWQEVYDLGLSIRPDTVVDVWKSWNDQDKVTLFNATRDGYRAVVSSCWYLDHLSSEWDDYYKCRPLEKLGPNATDAQRDLVMGGHGSMWGEHVDASNFMSRVWPRASAVAERLWKDSGAEVSAKQRITKFRCRMLERGIQAGPVHTGSCPVEPKFGDQNQHSHPSRSRFPVGGEDRAASN